MENRWFIIVVVIDGPNGVGKSTIAKKLCEKNKEIILIDDNILKEMYKIYKDYTIVREKIQKKLTDKSKVYNYKMDYIFLCFWFLSKCLWI